MVCLPAGLRRPLLVLSPRILLVCVRRFFLLLIPTPFLLLSYSAWVAPDEGRSGKAWKCARLVPFPVYRSSARRHPPRGRVVAPDARVYTLRVYLPLGQHARDQNPAVRPGGAQLASKSCGGRRGASRVRPLGRPAACDGRRRKAGSAQHRAVAPTLSLVSLGPPKFRGGPSASVRFQRP